MNTHIAILGTGTMGSALPRRLADAGFELTLWNRARARAEELGGSEHRLLRRRRPSAVREREPSAPHARKATAVR